MTTTAQPPIEQTVDKSDVRVRRMFGEIAGRYDFLNHFLSAGTDKYWRWRTVRKVPPQGDRPVLDLCTGTGDLAIAFARAGRGQTPVVASDFCHEMLVIGEAKRRKWSDASCAGQITFIEADSQQLPLPADHFQIVSVAFGLRNVSDTDRGLREMARVCAVGGKVVVLEFSMPRWQPFRAIYGWYFRNVLPRIGQLLARNSSQAYSYLPESVGEFPSGEALAERMRDAGLSDIGIHPLTFGVATLYIGTKEATTDKTRTAETNDE